MNQQIQTILKRICNQFELHQVPIVTFFVFGIYIGNFRIIQCSNNQFKIQDYVLNTRILADFEAA